MESSVLVEDRRAHAKCDVQSIDGHAADGDDGRKRVERGPQRRRDEVPERRARQRDGRAGRPDERAVRGHAPTAAGGGRTLAVRVDDGQRDGDRLRRRGKAPPKKGAGKRSKTKK